MSKDLLLENSDKEMTKMRFFAAIVLATSVALPAVGDTPIHDVLDQETRGLGRLPIAHLDSFLQKTKPLVGQVSYSRDWLYSLPRPKLADADTRCLSEALYFEARGESLPGQFAVAEVILNRVDSSLYPDTVCGVVHQGTGRKYQCQFTYTCDGIPDVISEKAAFDVSARVASVMVSGAPRALTDGATHYHTKAVRPNWSRQFPRTTTIGVHHFYRHPTILAQN
jgi:spore germination cell wall hydrolase CwlJ-like protein